MFKRAGILYIVLIFLCAVFAERTFYQNRRLKVIAPLEKSYDYNKTFVTKVIDGDTLRIENGERVRLIGVDTPESKINLKLKRDSKRIGKDYDTIVTMGKKAAEFTKSLVEGKCVRLEFDVEKRDKYNRLLAYVYLPDGRMLNAEIVKAGYAQIMTIPSNVMHQELFLKLQQEARGNKRGLWKDSL